MKLAELTAGVDAELHGDDSAEVAGIAYDSRDVAPGTLFFCVPGFSVDGHDYAAAAVDRGAVALVVERLLDLSVPQLRVSDARRSMALVAARWFDDPTRELTLVGVTGTNGKTTTTFLIRAALEAAGIRTGLLGTVKQIVGGREEAVVRTTPEAIDLQRSFRRMLEAGDQACVMEVSSHALALERTVAARFDAAAFTNLTQDHLDFHDGIDDYFAAKRRLFEPLDPWTEPPRHAVINVADPYGEQLAGELEASARTPVTTFSADSGEADFRAKDVAFDARGSRFTCSSREGEIQVRTSLPGHYNVENSLCAMAVVDALGVGLDTAAEAIRRVTLVPGRLEPVSEGQEFAVLVDYAHTPDSLANVLRAARRLTSGRVISVFGCGGDRDRDKRPKMGAIGVELSDVAIVTSDNPRSERPEAIIDEILTGVGLGSYEVEVDRRRAIARALRLAEDADTVVIAGKGHEEGQELADGLKIPFDDREVARDELRLLSR